MFGKKKSQKRLSGHEQLAHSLNELDPQGIGECTQLEALG